MSQSQNEEYILVGKIGASYGIKGWFKINAYTEVPEGIFDYVPWRVTLNGSNRFVKVAEWRRHNKGLIAKFDGVDNMNDAEAWLHGEIYVTADQLPELSDDEFYWRDLKDMLVKTDKGYDLGKVSGLMETGSNDVLVVDANPTDAFGKTERLIPYIQDDVILSVNKEENTITVDWDPGF
ncbi:ribosome maturation factor RimM [Psychrosphaera sp. B3R10]|uniref:Ribosome maturation factor RimM n=1 Tax=Psychrosphaera algicola TaxID=3023714 RepID=A0ABT5FBG7_9GAMM|nr:MULTISPECIES: ribosome maturation factor RimM [unclassified Psychrosphaera]MBU2881396.1 ribosome maturation factor RimM [Psychrosphaera sp. I2R16]MBU2989592.1 ribosome maturation factor RimM [Psychrosphaera sp. B3R10]MDC2888870.1 ribosome maturation factor RimM [Psychrosphaera sp. G1-22]